ncbi:hypothetical protein BCON_0077g00030 [Botryotinia convoluta]|uniref:Uncharacterized protein n=1 Tax=Botryotinia convoluta TaxID=54673 RepID=A0A4Z1I4B0_9HELO|nr:hypothetical protein BCON_0077g00030 [Botryotinia convoluta]
MAKQHGSTNHHCIRASEGNCRKSMTPGNKKYCSVHMQYCTAPGCEMNLPYGLRQFCMVCKGKADREEKLQKEADEKARKAKKAADALANASKGKKKPKTVK